MEKRQTDLRMKSLVYNHFENIGVLSTKTGLLKTLRAYYGSNKEALECDYGV